MEKLIRQGDKLMTVQEVADQFGCSPETVKGHIRDLFPGLMRNGKTTYLTPPQVTIILERMEQDAENIRGNQYWPNEESSTYKARLVGMETALTPTLKHAKLAELIERSHR
jgi:transposase